MTYKLRRFKKTKASPSADMLLTHETATVLLLACSRLSVSGGLKKRAGDEWGLVGKKKRFSLFLSRIPLAADPACRPLPFSIVITDREPGTGYSTVGTETPCDLIRMILTMNNLTLNDKHYLQIHGTGMGTRIAPSYANLFLAK